MDRSARPPAEDGRSPGADIRDVVLEAVEDVLIRYAPDGTVEWASDSLLSVFGYDPAQVAGTRLRMAADDERGRSTAEFDEAVRVGHDVVRVRARALRADGATRWADTVARIVRDDAGAVVCSVASIRDVTDLAEAERALTVANERNRILADNTSDVVLVYSASGILDWVSPSVAWVLGYDRADLVGSGTSIIHPDDRQRALADFATASRRGDRNMRNRLRIVSAEGGTRWMDCSMDLVRGPDGTHERTIASMRDVTAEVEAEAELRRARQQLSLIAENASDVVASSDGDGTIAWVSASVTTVLGWGVGDIVGTTLPDLAHPEDQLKAMQSMEWVARGDRVKFEVRLRTLIGEYRRLSLVVNPVVRPDLTVEGWVSSWRDAEREHALRQLQQDSENRYRLLAQNASDVVFQAAPDGRFIWVSPSVRDLLGHDSMSLPGQLLVGLVHPDDAAVVQAWLSAAHTDERVSLRVRVLRTDGGYIWMEITARSLLGAHGEVVARIGSARDVQEQVESEAAGDARRELMQASLDGMLDMQVLFGAVRDEVGALVDFRCLDANAAAIDYWSLPLDAIVGASLMGLFPGLHESPVFEHYRTAMETGQPVAVDDVVYDNEILGETRRYDIRLRRVSHDRLSVTWRDVTYRSGSPDE